jgi:hypothetical protein
MRLVKERVVDAWRELWADARNHFARSERCLQQMFYPEAWPSTEFDLIEPPEPPPRSNYLEPSEGGGEKFGGR